MKKTNRILGILLGVSLLGTVSASAVGPQWMDATHIFEADVAKLVDNVKLETRKEHAKRVKAPAPEPKKYTVGDKEVFWTKNIKENKFEKTPAILKAIGKHCYVFVEETKSLTSAAIEKIQKEFDEKNISGKYFQFRF